MELEEVEEDPKISRQREINRRNQEIEEELDGLLGVRTTALSKDFEAMRIKNQIAREEFFKALGEYYDPNVLKKHESPTRRLIDQKNSRAQHQRILNSAISRTQEYGQNYTTQPGQSYLVEPIAGELNYNLAYTNPLKFYDQVMEQRVVQHSVADRTSTQFEVSTRVTQRKIAEIMRNVQKKLVEIIWMKNPEAWSLEDVRKAMNNHAVQKIVQKHVESGEIMMGTITEADTEEEDPKPQKLNIESGAFSELETAISTFIANSR